MALVHPKTLGKHQHTSKKPCTSVSYCSSARLWKAIQQFINGDKRDEFKALFGDKDNTSQLVNVILSSRLSNDPLLYSRTTTKIDARLNETFGKLSATDLNALEITLLQHRHDTFAYRIVLLLKRHATPAECKQFVNHQFGKQGNTALHLASFWGMSRLVKALLDLGADPFVQNNRQLRPIDCTTSSDVISFLKEIKEPVKSRKPSVLLKKAVETMSPVKEDYYSDAIIPSADHFIVSSSPLSFSSSSSSSSSLSSLEHYTPPSSPLSLLDSIPSLPPSPAPVLTPIKQKKNEIKQSKAVIMDDEEEDEYEEDEVEDIIPPHRPGCLPSCDSPEVSQKEKKVRFDPRVIMMDSCVRGDAKEFTEWMDELNIREIKDVQNRSLLHIALMHGNEHLVDDLIHKVDINQPDHDGWTCLHYASALGLWKSLEKIASASDCNIHAQTYHGLRTEDCPNSEFGRRKCKIIIDRIQRRLHNK
ncbi:hypothetical protein G6F61_004213 [Rhizopus arrhizus]|nr:hypothetical protein G6F61_004213 [Rhizopus arrhizus]